MNSGPNFGSLIIIGGVAGISAFGLYLGYKELFERGKGGKKKNLKEILSSIESTGFDAEKTLKEHKEKIGKKKRYDKQEKTKRRSESELLLIDKKAKKDSDKKDSEKKGSEKSKEVADIETAKKVAMATIINMEKSDLPKVMDKKKLSTSNEDIESLVGIPVTEGINAQFLLENDTIRTIDKEIPKDSKKKKKCKKKKKSKEV
jgi:hypothetical protein